MSNKHFQLRLNARYQGEKNKIEDLSVEVLHNKVWEPLELDILSPGFLLFINGLFSCQHLYMRTNCAERNILLSSSSGEMQIEAKDNWEIIAADVVFNAKINSGKAEGDDLDYIIERMHHCPVSTNLPKGLRLNVAVNFE